MNWGNRLLLVFIVFGVGMCYLVYRSMSTNYEMVESDYYKQELRYQQVIDASKKANALSSAVKASADAGEIKLQFPDEMKNKVLTGEVYFYCGSDSQKDRHITLKTDANGEQTIPAGKVVTGTYTLKIKWNAEAVDYYTEIPLSVL